MIEFIIIEDDKNYLSIVKQQVDKLMMNYDYTYKISKELTDNSNFKVYIIDCNNKKDLDQLEEIRYEQDDWSSMIIVISKNKLINEIINLKIMPIDIIEKDNYFESNISRGLTIALRNYNSRPKTIKYKYKTIYYNIELKEILYIEKEKDSKRTIIKTKYEKYPYPSNLSNIEQLLDNRFIKCSRSYIINIEQVRQYNTKDNIITLKDGNCIYEIARDKKKDIINYLRRVD